MKSGNTEEQKEDDDWIKRTVECKRLAKYSQQRRMLVNKVSSDLQK